MLNLGILSTAKIAREHVIPAALQARGVAVAGIASRRSDAARSLAAHFQIPRHYGSYDALLADAQIDAVYIPLPTSQHVEWAMRCADAGKHVLVEKPLALNAADIDQVLQAQQRNRVIVSEAFMVQYHPQWQMVREWIESGRIGRLRHVQGSFSYFNRDPENMRNQPSLGGGALPDIGVYPVVTTRLVSGQEPLSVNGQVEFDEQFGTDVYATALIEFEGFHLDFYVSTCMGLRQTMCFHGERGSIEVSAPFNAGVYDMARVTLYDQNRTEQTTQLYANVNQYQLQLEAFAKAVADGDASSLFSLRDSISNQCVIDAIYRSASEQGVVKL